MSTPEKANGRVVLMECRMRSRASFEAEAMAGFDGVPAIRLRPISTAEREFLKGQIPDGSTWAWAIVQVRRGFEDALFVGGTAESQTSAVAQAQIAWGKLEEKWARERAEGKVQS